MRRWARLVTSHPRIVTALVIFAIAASGLWGAAVLDRLNLAGYTDPASESALVETLIRQRYGRQTPDVVVIYTAPAGKTLEDIREPVVERISRTDSRFLAKPVESYWTSVPALRDAMVSADHRKALVVLTLTGDENQRLHTFESVATNFEIPGIQTRFAGFTATTRGYNEESTRDLLRVESIAIPLTSALLIVVFGGLVAAAVPVCVGAATVLGSLAALRVLSYLTDVSGFAVNMATLLGLGMAVDYGLLMVSRFREELRTGYAASDAARRTMCTAGRTVLLSALLLAGGFAGMTVFRLAMVRSLGYGAIAAVAIAALLSLTVVPAVLALLGPRVNALAWRRGAVQRGEIRAYRFWGRLAVRVAARPVTSAVGILAALGIAAVPIAGIEIGGFDMTGLPSDNPARVAQEVLTKEFPLANNGATLIVRAEGGAVPADAWPRSVTRFGRRPVSLRCSS
ncbi:MMPL family transporter [Nocardia sp. NPDC052566]|uniref:MMPL family transporter n=1 Tax=Nocardia sp. NPDC052566 TaxID=3364330 RepID=UPI0037C884F5